MAYALANVLEPEQIESSAKRITLTICGTQTPIADAQVARRLPFKAQNGKAAATISLLCSHKKRLTKMFLRASILEFNLIF